MIEQLWFTASPVGLGQSPGWQVRAASPALRDQTDPHIRQIMALLRYELPASLRPFKITPSEAPLSMCWLRVNGERVLLQRAFIGLTWDRRPGNTFSHLLTKLPADFGAYHAIDLWRSTLWACSDTLDPHDLALPQLKAAQLVPGPLAATSRLEGSLARYLESLVIAYYYYVFHKIQHIYIVAQPDLVVQLIWGLIRAFPARMLAELTFSTFERYLDKPTTPTIAGVYPAHDQSPTAAAVYALESDAVVIDLAHDTVRGLPVSPRASAYAATVVQLLVAGDRRLKDFISSINMYQSAEIDVIDGRLQYYLRCNPFPII